MKQNILRLFSTIAILLLFVAAADAKTRKGEKLLAEGKVAEDHGDWDKALDLYQQAVDDSPSDPAYMIAMRRARFQAGQKHVDLGQKLRSEGKVARSEEHTSELQSH